MTDQSAHRPPDDADTLAAKGTGASPESGTDPAPTPAAMPISGPALVDEENRASGRDLDPEGSILPPPRLEGTQPGGMPIHRFD